MNTFGTCAALLIAVCWLVAFALSPGRDVAVQQSAHLVGAFAAVRSAAPVAAAPVAPTAPTAPVSVAVGDIDDMHLQRAPSISPAHIDRILESYGSPAVGTGQMWYDLGVQYHIDPAYAVAFFIHESSAGTNPAWAGWKGDGSTTHNVGNIICAGYATCYGRFRDYPTWTDGIADWYRLIAVEYIEGRGHQTVADVIPVYAPSFENNVDAYIGAVEKLVRTWRDEESH